MSTNKVNPGKLSEEQMAELLEAYLDALERDPHAQPPQGLDPQTVRTAQMMNAAMDAPEPRPEFVATLRGQLDRAAAQQSKTQAKETRGGFSWARWSWVGVAAAVVVALVAVGAWMTRPAPVDAGYVLTRARDAVNNFESVGVRTFEIESISEQPMLGEALDAPPQMVTTTTKMWYGDESHWRVETSDATTNARVQPNIQVRDGDTTWFYDAFNNMAYADSYAPMGAATFDAMTAQSEAAPNAPPAAADAAPTQSENAPSAASVPSAPSVPLPNVGSLEVLNQDVSNCWTPRVVGAEVIAGRTAYKIDMGTNKCHSAALPIYQDATRTLWVDKETFFVLRDQITGKDGTQNLGSYEVTAVKYNQPIAPADLSFTPPQGSMLNDNRPKPAPSQEELLEQLRQMEQESGLALNLPQVLPDGLVARVPKFDPLEPMVTLEYTRPELVETNALADMNGLIIRQVPATEERIEMWTAGLEPAGISRYRTWILRGEFDAATQQGTTSVVDVVIGDTLVSVSSFVLDADELLEVALSMQPLE